MGYLYVIGTDNGLVKIGITERHVEERIRALQTGCPFAITKVWHSDNLNNYMKCERILHAFYIKQKTHGEWFQIDYDDAVIAAKRVCDEIGNDGVMKYINDLYDRITALDNEVSRLRYGQHKPPRKWA